jgi:hypothetical protein
MPKMTFALSQVWLLREPGPVVLVMTAGIEHWLAQDVHLR